MRQKLDILSFRVSGSIAKGAPDWTIYQHNGHKLTKYPGPKIPANPRRRGQQLNRRRFIQAIHRYSQLSTEQKQFYQSKAKSIRKKANPLTVFVSRFLSRMTYDSSFYGEGSFNLHNPKAAIFYYGEALFNENFLLSYDSAPRRDQYQSKNYNHSLLSS